MRKPTRFTTLQLKCKNSRTLNNASDYRTNGQPVLLSLALVLGLELSSRTNLESLALDLRVKSLALALMVKSLALALRVSPWSWPSAPCQLALRFVRLILLTYVLPLHH